MRKTKLTALLIMSALGIINIHAELRHFLPTTNAYISIYEHKYWFEGDTIIDNKEYIKVYQQFCSSETECSENKDYYAAVRQDTINEKIYCIQVDDGVERLIADFDVNVGDEITVYSFSYWGDNWRDERLVEIQDVDEIIIDGQHRKRISIADTHGWRYNPDDPDFPYDVWIEGLGSIVYGLFFPSPELIIDACPNPQFFCLHIDDELIYQTPDVNTCYKEPECLSWGYEGCVRNCKKSGGEESDCRLYCAPLFDDKFKAFQRCVTDCTNEGGEFGDCLSHCIEEYNNTGIPNNSYKKFNISLSPTNDYLSVKTELPSCSYLIYNTLGAIVKQGRLSGSDINIATLNQGIYYAVFYHNKELIYMHKLIK